MSLALFDLDQTLISADSDYLWGEFLLSKNLVDKNHYSAANKMFFNDYKNGVLDIDKYLQFCLRPLSHYSRPYLLELREEFVTNCIKPTIYEQALVTIEQHKKNKDYIVIISASNEFIVEGVSALFSVDDYIATNIEIKNNRYTGRHSGIPCFRAGKVDNLNNWLKNNHYSIEGSYFYSDSINDLPLLQSVTNPIATNPDADLTEYAKNNNWQIVYW